MMKKYQTSQGMALGLLVILMSIFLLTQTALGAVLLSSPWWVYFVLAAIIFSGYMSVKYTIEDRRLEQDWIEKEGHVYMERLEEEKQKRTEERS